MTKKTKTPESDALDREATIKLAAACLCARAAQFGDPVIAEREPTPKDGEALMEAAVSYARAIRL